MIEAIIGAVWPYLIAIVAMVAAFLGVRQSGKSAGRAQVEREQAQASAKAREKMREIDNEVDSLGDSDLDRRDERWVRGDKW